MKLNLLLSGLALLANTSIAQRVSGAAEGFAQGVVGGGNAPLVVPKDIKQLVSFLTDKTPRVIVLDKTYDFTNSEGSVHEKGCAPWGTKPGCQLAINLGGKWCGKNPTNSAITYDKAGTAGIQVASHKTLIGVGNKGVIKGKGLRFVNVEDVIVQNIHVTTLNPHLVWGGDAFTFSGAKRVWVDHCTTSLLGRQHYVFGPQTSTGITLSNNYVDGHTQWSSGCDGYHYWSIEMTGNNDQITMQNNYITHTAGRGPALSATTLLHAVNNVWSDVKGHAIEGDKAGKGLFEGNSFSGVKEIVIKDFKGQLNSCPDGNAANAAKQFLGRPCQGNVYSASGAFDRRDTGFLGEMRGLPIARANSAAVAKRKVPGQAGFGKI